MRKKYKIMLDFFEKICILVLINSLTNGDIICLATQPN